MPLLSKEGYVQRVLTILNENDREQEYSATRVREYIEDLFPLVWRRAVERFPRGWFTHKNALPEVETLPLLVGAEWGYNNHLNAPSFFHPTLYKEYSKWEDDIGTLHALYEVRPWHFIHYPEGVGAVVLPPDFLRLAEFRLEGWHRSCHTAQPDNDEVSFKQANRYTRGTPYRPVCVIRQGTRLTPDPQVVKGVGVYGITLPPNIEEQVAPFRGSVLHATSLLQEPTTLLWYYSLPQGSREALHHIARFTYIPELRTLPTTKPLQVSSVLWEPLLYMGAMVTLEALELFEEATPLEARLKEMIEHRVLGGM